MSLILRAAWRNIGRQGRRSAITICAMVISVGTAMPLVAMNDGLLDRMYEVLVRTRTGHVQIHNPEYPKRKSLHETIEDPEPLLDELRDIDGLGGLSARVYGYALLGTEHTGGGGQLIGVFPSMEQSASTIFERVVDGRAIGEDADREIMLGAKLAETLEVGPGDEIVAMTQAADGSLGNDVYAVVGVFESGDAMRDRAGAYLHARDLQELLVLGDQVHEIVVNAADREAVDDMAAAVRERAEGRELLIRTWSEVDPTSAQMIGAQDAVMMIFLALFFLAAALGVLNTMLMAVYERTRELGVLQALGMKPRSIMGMIAAETVLMTLIAMVLGGLLGGLLDYGLIVHGIDLSRFTDGFSFTGVFFEPVIRGAFRPGRLVSIFSMLLTVSLMASLLPAFRAAMLKPVTAMRKP